MATNFRPLREAIVTHLKEDDAFTTKLPAGSIHGMRQPADATWPFSRYGSPDGHPLRSQCLKGSIVDVTLHVFSKDTFDDECSDILQAMEKSIDGADGKGVTLTLEGGQKAHMKTKGSQIIPDAAEASAWHGLCHIEATIVS